MTRLLGMALIAGLLGACTFGDGGTRVVVNGETYDVFVLHPTDLNVSSDDLTVAGDVEVSQGSESLFGELTAYALDGVDPRGILLIPTAPGQGDDGGRYADYLGLMGPATSVPAVCVYFEPGRFDGC